MLGESLVKNDRTSVSLRRTTLSTWDEMNFLCLLVPFDLTKCQLKPWLESKQVFGCMLLLAVEGS